MIGGSGGSGSGDGGSRQSVPDLKIPGDGDTTDLQIKLEESMAEEEAASAGAEGGGGELQKNSSFLANENLHPNADEQDQSKVFPEVWYLGQKEIKDPKNERSIHAQIRELNVLDDLEKISRQVSVGVPFNADGNVVVADADPNGGSHETIRLPVNRIIFFARGTSGTSDASCFAFTVAVQAAAAAAVTSGSGSGEEKPKVLFLSHVFRCSDESVVAEVFTAFAHAFKKPGSPAATADVSSAQNREHFYFEVSLEIRECDQSDVFDVVPRQKNMFKLRRDVEKKVVINVSQISKGNSCRLHVERCFGLLVSPGRNVRHADMQLLERVTMSASADPAAAAGDNTSAGDQLITITGDWDPRESAFALLNQETPADVQSVFVTIAADLVVSQ